MNRYFLLRTSAAVVLFGSCSGCIYGGDVQAPNGYSIQCDKGRNCIVASDNGNYSELILAGPEVDRGAVVNQFLIGHVTNQRPSFGGTTTDIPTEKTGFFILDTNSGSFVYGLDETQWKQELVKRGILDSTLYPTDYKTPQPK